MRALPHLIIYIILVYFNLLITCILDPFSQFPALFCRNTRMPALCKEEIRPLVVQMSQHQRRARLWLLNAAMTSYLASEEATHADDAEDVEDGRADDRPDTHVTFGDEHPWGGNEPAHTQTTL